ncbi:hypothetical protein [Aquipseudomonas campi]
MNDQAPVSQPNPRALAAEILAEPSITRRQELLGLCPSELREIVQEHVRAGFAKIKSYRKHQEMRAGLASEKPPAAPRRESCTNITNHPRSAPEVGNAAIARLRAAIGKGAA